MKSLIAFIAILLSLNVYAQDVKYQKTYTDALALASKTNKPIFITLLHLVHQMFQDCRL